MGSLGAALVWAGRHQVKELHLLVDASGEAGRRTAPGGQSAEGRSAEGRSAEGIVAVTGRRAAAGAQSADDAGAVAGVLARRARLWAVPPTVWTVAGREVRRAEPAPLPAAVEPPAAAREWIAVLREHGVEVVVEGGVITGEVLGLEVARVVPDAAGAGWHVEVGVGRHDRQATQELRRDEPLADALDRVVAVVRGGRVAGVARGPANSLARERWLRSVVTARPELAGAARLEPLAPPVVRKDLVRPSPAAAAGVGLDGRPMVAVCSVGVDPDLVPTAADVRDLFERSGALAGGLSLDTDHLDTDPLDTDGSEGGLTARLALVVPEGDDYPVTRELAAALADPAEVVVVPRDWAALA